MSCEAEAGRILKAAIARRGLTYDRLSAALQRTGVMETERSIANKISRGTFQFAFVLQCLRAMGLETFTISLDRQRVAARPSQTDARPRKGTQSK